MRELGGRFESAGVSVQVRIRRFSSRPANTTDLMNYTSLAGFWYLFQLPEVLGFDMRELGGGFESGGFSTQISICRFSLGPAYFTHSLLLYTLLQHFHAHLCARSSDIGTVALPTRIPTPLRFIGHHDRQSAALRTCHRLVLPKLYGLLPGLANRQGHTVQQSRMWR